ncbi:MAG: hypothetical protein GXP38_04590 [Chloroflexi bacterium]|nr:hypothetical protein [Chloroflexota bacterium]
MSKHSPSPNVFRPETLLAALKFIREQGGGVHMVGTAPSPLSITPSGTWLDTRRLPEMAGIHRFGGKLVVGLNTSHAELSHASLLRSHALCLVETCEALVAEGDTLSQDLQAQPWPHTILALATLAAEVEVARLLAKDVIERQWLPWDEVFPAMQVQTQLPLAVRFDVSQEATGSAYVRMAPLPHMDSPVEAAAVHLFLADQGPLVKQAQIAVMLHATHLPLRLRKAEFTLSGHVPTPERLHNVAEIAHNELFQHLRSADPPIDYTINPTAHLVRRSLDRAIARAHAASAAHSS